MSHAGGSTRTLVLPVGLAAPTGAAALVRVDPERAPHGAPLGAVAERSRPSAASPDVGSLDCLPDDVAIGPERVTLREGTNDPVVVTWRENR